MEFYRILILTLCAYALISCGGAEERKAAYLEKAKVSLEAGDLEKARIELKNVLQIDPKDADAYHELGKIHEQKQEYRKAYGNYLKAEELNPDLLANHARLGRFYLLLMNDTDKAQEKIDLILAKEPENVDGLLLKAAIKLKNNEINEAMSIAKNIVAKNPDHTESIAFLASLYARENNLSDAINVLDAGLTVSENNEQLNRLLAAALIKNKNYERAEKIYISFLERNPDSSASYNNLAAFYGLKEDNTKVEETLRASVENDPDDVDRQLTLIKFIRSIKSNDEAIKEIKELITKNNRQGKLRSALAELFLLNNDKVSAVETYQKAINDFSEEETGIVSRTALASIYISEKDYDKASKIVEEAILISPNEPGVNLLKAKLALQNKDYENAILSLRVVVKESPENIEAYLLLSAAHAVQGEEEQAKSAITSARENNRTNPEALQQLLQYFVKTNNSVQAEKVIDDLLTIDANNYEALSMKVNILNSQKKFEEVKPLAEKLVSAYPDKANGYVYSIPYLANEQTKTKALALLKEGYSKVEDNRVILKLLTSMQVSNDQADEALRRIDQALVKKPDDIDLLLLQAKVSLATKDTAVAEARLKEIIKKDSTIEEVYLLLAGIYKNANNESAYLDVIKNGHKNANKPLKVSLSLARHYELEKAYNAAIDIYEQVLINYPNNLVVTNNLASMLSDHKKDEASMSRAKELADKLKESEQPVILDTVGWVYYKVGDYSAAIEALQSVVAKEPAINIFNYHLGMAYKASGDTENARTYLSKSLEDGKEFDGRNEAKKALSEL